LRQVTAEKSHSVAVWLNKKVSIKSKLLNSP